MKTNRTRFQNPSQSQLVFSREIHDARKETRCQEKSSEKEICETEGRKEEAVKFLRQAAEIHTQLRDVFMEGKDCHNAAVVLIELGRFDEARAELTRALECNRGFGPTFYLIA